jgi:hypothetical protein
MTEMEDRAIAAVLAEVAAENIARGAAGHPAPSAPVTPPVCVTAAPHSRAGATVSAPTPGATYSFPSTDAIYVGLATETSSYDAKRLLDCIKAVSRLELDYFGIRAAFCAFSVALNRLGVFPPRIRDTRRLKPRAPGAKLTMEEQCLSHDRQVLDLHWLHSTAQGRAEKGWSDLLTGREFNFDRAARFVITVGSAENKAIALRLARGTELQLAVIQTKAVRDSWRDIERGVGSVVRATESARHDARRPEKVLNMAAEAYQALRIAEGSPLVAVRVLRQFWGIEATEDQVRRCRDWLKDRGLLATR